MRPTRWLVSLLGAALLALSVWIVGESLPEMQDWRLRLPVIAAIVILWAGANLLIEWRNRRRDAALAEGVAAGEPAASAAEAAALRDKLNTALNLLRKSRGGRGYLYEQPWYVIIGPPGAGKTTALLNSGLRFPLADEIGKGSIAGVGGTRLCEWWFTENAVLIDTAGRYATQDSDAAVDRAGWEAFLGLLKRTRPRLPLNGVIAAIALSDIAGAPQAERLQHARAIKQRVKELEERLGIRLPIYAIFTKADLIAGFTEFFDDLDREKRSQVWGATFALTDKPAGPIAGFQTEFRNLIERLNHRLFDRLQAERNPERRAMIAGFAPQVASLEAPLNEFLQPAFGGSQAEPAPMLRGVYFTSGTQEGSPIDRLTGVLSRSFGIEQRRTPSLRPEQGRSYFLTRLVQDVIFGEAMLACERPGELRRRRLLRAGGFAGIAAAALAVAGLLWEARHEESRRLNAMAAALDRYEQAARPLAQPGVDADLARVLPALDQARGLAAEAGRRPTHAALFPFSLGHEATLAPSAQRVYHRALEQLMLPRLVGRLEKQMQSSLGQSEFLFQATRVYLMLGSQGPLDRDTLRAWLLADWEIAYPGSLKATVRDGLLAHLDALLAAPLPETALNKSLLDAARDALGGNLANRAYSLISTSAAATGAKMWRPSDAVGVKGTRAFIRTSGKPLGDGIPGFYTREAFHEVLLPALPAVIKQVAGESWVLGVPAPEPDSPAEAQLERDIVALYEAEFRKQWDLLLADLAIQPLRSPQQAAQLLGLIVGPPSPMRRLLAAVAQEVTLTEAQPASSGAPIPGASIPSASIPGAAILGAATPAVPVAAAPIPAAGMPAPAGPTDSAAKSVKLTDAVSQLKPLLAANSPEAASLPGSETEAYYRPLRDFVGAGPGAPIDSALYAIEVMQHHFAHLAATASQSAAGDPVGEDAAAMLRQQAAAAPQPVARWLDDIALQSGTIHGAAVPAADGSAVSAVQPAPCLLSGDQRCPTPQ